MKNGKKSPSVFEVIIIVISIFLMLVTLPFTHSMVRGAHELQGDPTRSTLVVNRTGGGDFTTIQAAVDSAGDGDVILVHEGWYYEHIVISGKSLTIKGVERTEVIIDGEDVGTGIEIKSDGNHIEKLKIQDTQDALVLSTSNDNDIRDIIFSNNAFSGIKSSGECEGNVISDCTFTGNNYGMRFMEGFAGNEITESTVNNNNYGIYLFQADGNIITENTCNSNEPGRRNGMTSRNFYMSPGIYLDEGSDGNTINGNTCNGNGDYGIYLYKATQNQVKNNVCNDNEDSGIFLISSSDNVINNNLLESNSLAGINIVNSPDNSLDGNTCQYSGEHGIILDSSPSSILKNNVLNDCGLFVNGYDLDNWNTHTIDGSNAINGKIIGYFSNMVGGSISGSNYGQIILANCTNVTVSSISALNGSIGIMLASSSRNRIEDNICNSNIFYGIHLQSNSNENEFTNNYCKSNKYGIYVDEFCVNNIFDENSCDNNQRSGLFIAPHSNGNNIINQTCQNNENGIEVSSSSNHLLGCELISNTDCGILLSEGTSANEVKQCIAKMNDHGIYLDHSSSNDIFENECSLNREGGIYATSISATSIADNVLCDNLGEGMNIRESTFLDISGNLVDNNEYGLIVNNLDDSTFLSNIITQNQVDGVVATECTDNEFILNEFENSGQYGARIRQSSSHNIFQKNLFKTNEAVALFFESGNSNTVYLNNFIENGGGLSQAIDNGTGNNWNFEGGMGDMGNYWSDYTLRYPSSTNDGQIWADSYEVSGSSGAKDEYPLFQSVDRVSPVAILGEDVIVDLHTIYQFDSSGCTDNLGITNFTWKFVHGSQYVVLYGPNPAFNFSIVGSFEVFLEVRDVMDNSAQDSIVITVRDSIPPEVILGDDLVLSLHGGTYIDGSKCSDNVQIVNYTWTFIYDGVERLDYRETFYFTFDIFGIYTFHLTILDSMGNAANGSFDVRVEDNEKPTANAGPATTIENGMKFQFDGTSSWDEGGIVNYTWTFSYNNTIIVLSGEKSEFVFEYSGTYFVTLRVEDAFGNNDTDQLSLTVKGAVVPGDDDDNDNNNGTAGIEEDGGIDKTGMSTVLVVAIFGGAFFLLMLLIIISYVILNRTKKSALKEEQQAEYEKLYGTTPVSLPHGEVQRGGTISRGQSRAKTVSSHSNRSDGRVQRLRKNRVQTSRRARQPAVRKGKDEGDEGDEGDENNVLGGGNGGKDDLDWDY